MASFSPSIMLAAENFVVLSRGRHGRPGGRQPHLRGPPGRRLPPHHGGLAEARPPLPQGGGGRAVGDGRAGRAPPWPGWRAPPRSSGWAKWPRCARDTEPTATRCYNWPEILDFRRAPLTLFLRGAICFPSDDGCGQPRGPVPTTAGCAAAASGAQNASSRAPRGYPARLLDLGRRPAGAVGPRATVPACRSGPSWPSSAPARPAPPAASGRTSWPPALGRRGYRHRLGWRLRHRRRRPPGRAGRRRRRPSRCWAAGWTSSIPTGTASCSRPSPAQGGLLSEYPPGHRAGRGSSRHATGSSPRWPTW